MQAPGPGPDPGLTLQPTEPDPAAKQWKVMTRREVPNGAVYEFELVSYAQACRYAAGDPDWRQAPGLEPRLNWAAHFWKRILPNDCGDPLPAVVDSSALLALRSTPNSPAFHRQRQAGRQRALLCRDTLARHPCRSRRGRRLLHAPRAHPSGHAELRAMIGSNPNHGSDRRLAEGLRAPRHPTRGRGSVRGDLRTSAGVGWSRQEQDSI
jgi:hypothetical protein